MTQERDPVDLAAQEVAAAEQAEDERTRQIILDDDLLWEMQQKIGRRFVFRLLSDTGVFRNPYVDGNSEGTSFKCGEMNVGQRYLASIMRLCPELFHIMIKEQENVGRKRKRSSDTSSASR